MSKNVDSFVTGFGFGLAAGILVMAFGIGAYYDPKQPNKPSESAKVEKEAHNPQSTQNRLESFYDAFRRY